MKFMFVLTFIGLVSISARVYPQGQTLTIQMQDATLYDLLKRVENQSSYRFFFNDDLIGINKSVDINAVDMDIDALLNQLLSGTGLKYKQMDNNLIVISSQMLLQQQTVMGTVTDQEGEPIPGVNVVVKGTITGTVSDTNGKYQITVPDKSTVLVFSFIGYRTHEFTVGDQQIIDIQLNEDTHEIDEVIVTALGIKREEKSLGYSVQKVGGDAVQAVKGTNIATSLTGKVAGLTVKNSTELIDQPEITLRGGTPLIVIDEIAYGNMKLKDISPEDIESMDILKGPTASALYGVRGANGAIMITTKKGEEGRLTVSASNNTMFNAGFLRIPKNQSSYSSGKVENGKLNYDSDYVWGPYMDGSMVQQYDGKSKSYQSMPFIARGKDNLKNFIENSYVTTTNLNVSQAGKAGSYRISGTFAHTKGQYPNSKLSRYNLAATGTINYGDFKATGNLSIGKMTSPNVPNRTAYGSGNIIYNMIIWTGTDYDVRDFRDYWLIENEKQNWMWKGWYDNPYFIAYENIYTMDQAMTSGSVNLQYKFNKYLKAILRSGYDSYNNMSTLRQSIGGVQYKTGYYYISQPTGWSWNNDFLLQLSEYAAGDFKFDALGGLSSSYDTDYYFSANTDGGLSIPGFYSLESSVKLPAVAKSEYSKLMYSAYAKASVSYKSMVYVDVTGRNDWSSTLPADERSFFYPSIALSFIPTEIYNPLEGSLDFWKLRGSWTVSKEDPEIYANNMAYRISKGVWDDYSSAAYPSRLKDPGLKPKTERSFEFGTDLRFFKGRLFFDYTYFTRYQYHRIINAEISGASGFTEMSVNTGEDRVQRGMEFSLRVQPVLNEKFAWMARFNLGFYHWYYAKFDDEFSEYDPRVSKGSRVDRYMTEAWQKDASGNQILNAGKPIRDPYTSLLGYTDPKFVFGFTNEFMIGDFDIHISFDGRVGGVMYAQTNQAMWNSGAHPDSDNQYRYDEVVNGKGYLAEGVKIVSGKLVADNFGNIISDDRVFAPNDVETVYSDYVKTVHGNAYTARPDNVVDPTFVKLRELAINYTLPKQVSDKFGCRKLTVGIIGQNLLMWTKSKQFKYADPDRGVDQLNSPSYRLIGFNINVTL